MELEFGFGDTFRLISFVRNCNRPAELDISFTFGRRLGYHTVIGRLQIPTRAPRQTFWVARVFFPRPMAPSSDGARAEPLLICCSAPHMQTQTHDKIA